MDISSRSSLSGDEFHWNRRQFLTTSALGLAVVGFAGSLAACTGSASTSTSKSPAAGGSPKRGGTLRLGGNGGASTDTLDAHNILTNQDTARAAQLYDPLVRLDNQGHPELVLAESITSNATATEWTIKIRSGVVTHKGKPFTADDVLFSFQRMFDNKFPGSLALGALDLKNSKAVDRTTVVLKYPRPFAIMLDALSLYYINMVPRGYNPKDPDGTGPFKYKSFTPGVESTFVRNENYWQYGKPYLDAIVTSNIADETSQVNALQAGQVDAINFLSAGSVAVLKGSGMNVITSKTGGWDPFTLRVDQKPFTDVRVRQAFRLIPDRPQILKQVFGGNGTVGNDVFGVYDKNFPTDLPQRQQDIPQAKSLLKAAGYSDLTVNLVTLPEAPGMIATAQVFATQAKAAGVTVKITQQTPTDYFANSYLKTTSSQDYWPTQPYLVAAGQALAGPNAPFNACHFDDPEYNSLYAQAVAATDASKQTDLVHEMVHLDYDRGAYVIPFFFPIIDAYSNKVQGVQSSATGYSPGGLYWADFWLS
jgi:peptide/nickel transport system substrate-binding protein